VENGTHVLFGSRMADYATSEVALAKTVLPNLGNYAPSMNMRSFLATASRIQAPLRRKPWCPILGSA